ncbi:MAG: hypothetical protein R3B13_24880 [Polyangiaceae bacterium]
MIRFELVALGTALALFGLGCTETPVSLPLRSLERSGEVSFACVSPDGKGSHIDDCPDFEGDRRMLALVTQTLRGEVAVVDLSAGSVVDYDPSTPGFNFIPVGENPGDIVTTPGGVASFVGVTAINHEGIVALPSSCLRRPARDLTNWPACSLPSAPGQMHVLIDPADDQGRIRASCDASPSDEAATPGSALAATREICPADLALESVQPGRRKLLVEMPELGGFAVIDAQELLDREPGSFGPCLVERFVPLSVALPPGEISQPIPADLQAPGCVPPSLNHGPRPDGFLPRPSGFAAVDARLYVADQGAPVVHELDVQDPCAIAELPPLLPVSFESKGRVVTTRKVAVSPATRAGNRFLYSIDELEGSVMVFDVTPGSANRTPIVREGTPLLPFEPADRISFSSPARDIAFALRDAPQTDPQTGVGTVGTLCDPDPDLDTTTPAAKYRTSLDYTRGARPRQLRGVFGFIALASGQVAVVDVEDWDAACRRPIFANASTEEDFRGCSGDVGGPEFFTLDKTEEGRATVSAEASCRVVMPHRARSGNFVIAGAEFGTRAPALRSFPRLRAAEGGNLPTDQSDEGRQHPRMLAVDFAGPGGGADPAEVFVGTNRYVRDSSNSSTALVIDPKTAERLSLGLMRRQPRAFGEEDVVVEYEGALTAERPAGFVQIDASLTSAVLSDADGAFCDRGVEDSALAREVATGLGVADSKLDGYAARHGDYVQVTSSLRSEDDRYWVDGAGKSCGGATGKAAFLGCRTFFGTADTPSTRRDFTITEARQNSLMLTPRGVSASKRQDILERLACCFGGAALRYKVRAGKQWILKGANSGFRHNVIADGDLRCIRDCNPRRSLLRSRILEVSSTCTGTDCAIGHAAKEDVACVVNSESALSPGSAGSECVFENLMYRFAIYRGNSASVRDMAFSFQVTGGFAPLTANLAAQTAAVAPQSMGFVPQLGQLALVDGAAEGLVLVSLDTVGISRLFF